MFQHIIVINIGLTRHIHGRIRTYPEINHAHYDEKQKSHHQHHEGNQVVFENRLVQFVIVGGGAASCTPVTETSNQNVKCQNLRGPTAYLFKYPLAEAAPLTSFSLMMSLR